MQPELSASTFAAGAADRAYHVDLVTRIAGPVLRALAQGRLKAAMPVTPWEIESGRVRFALLEITGRTLSGLAPWLALGADDTPEGRTRADLITMARQGVVSIADPASPDFGTFFFPRPHQPLVDAAFLAQALLRAPQQLWRPLSAVEKANVAAALQATRRLKPSNNNHLLFAALIEAALWQLTGEGRIRPIRHAVRSFMRWYLGDGTYSDGPHFHWDHYNSYVIQPYLLQVLDICARHGHPLACLLPEVERRARRFAEVQERLISPEGTYPVIGRSSIYRSAAFHHLAYMALTRRLPASLDPGAVRAGLTLVLRRMFEVPGTFDAAGWLRPGVAGHQASMRDSYTNSGSCYCCLDGLVALGLPPDDPFWTAPAAPWTQKRLWSGAEMPNDRYIPEPVRVHPLRLTLRRVRGAIRRVSRMGRS